MSSPFFVLLVALPVLASCQREAGPPLVVSDLRVFAPTPGSGAGAAYLKIENHGDGIATIFGAKSPQFSKVEFHETIIEDGVSRMRPIEELQIAAGARVVFESGGKHIMLMGPRADVVRGSPVTLELAHNGGLLIVSSTVQTRLPAE